MTEPRVVELHSRKITPEQYHEIRRLWQIHSIAEDKRDIPGLMSTLTDDCVYELVQTGDRWERKEGATRFYTEMLAPFPIFILSFKTSSLVRKVCSRKRTSPERTLANG